MRIHWKPSEREQIIVAALNWVLDTPVGHITKPLEYLREGQKVLPANRRREITAVHPFRELIDEVRARFYTEVDVPPVIPPPVDVTPSPELTTLNGFFNMLAEEVTKRVLSRLAVSHPQLGASAVLAETVKDLPVFNKQLAKANVAERSLETPPTAKAVGILIVGLLPGQIQVLRSRLFNLKGVSLSFLSIENVVGSDICPRHRNYLMTKFISHSVTNAFSSVPRERVFQVTGGLGKLEELIRFHHSMENKS